MRVLECRALAWLGLGEHLMALEDAHAIIRLDERRAKGYLLAGKIFRASAAREAARKTYALALRKVPPSDPKYAELQAHHVRLVGAAAVPPGMSSGAAAAVDVPMPDIQPSAHLFGSHPVPVELVLRILAPLALADLCRLCATSRQWRALLCHSPQHWRSLVLDASTDPRPPPSACVVALLGRAGAQLEHLTVARAALLADPLLTLLAKSSPARLYTLALPGCVKLSPKALAAPFTAPGAAMRNLTTLHLAHSNLDDRALCAVLARCKGLQHLDLSGCDLLSDVAFVKHRPARLRHLALAHCQISDAAVRACLPSAEAGEGAASALRHLNLAQCPRITVALFPSLAGLPLVGLLLPGIRFGLDAAPLEDGLLAWGSEAPPAAPLRHLDLGSCPILSDLALDYVSAFHPTLQHLDLSTCVRLTDAGIGLLARQCTSGLRVVVLRACQRITDVGVQELLHHHHPTLVTLDVGNTRITAGIVVGIVQGCKQLVDLCLRQTQVPVRAARALAGKAGRPLRRLDISGCPGYDNRLFADLAKALPACRITSGDVQY